MAKEVLHCCLFFALFACAVGTWTINDYNVPCDTKNITITLVAGTIPTYFSLFHCVGEYDLYVDLGDSVVPSDQNRSPWDATQTVNTVTVNTTGHVSFLAVAKNNYNGTCATFNIAQYDTESDLTKLYAEPSNDEVSAKLADGGKSGTVTWTKTNNAQDTYSLYWANTQTAPAGQNFATACSVKTWMKPFTEDNGSIKDNGDNTMTATVKGLDPQVPFNIVVVVDRNASTGGNSSIGGVYEAIALNGKNDGSALLPSAVLAVVVILAMLW